MSKQGRSSPLPAHPPAGIRLRFAVLVASTLVAAGCATTPGSGGQSGTAVTGAAGGANAAGANSSLATCPQTLGTVRIEENTNASWYQHYTSQYRGLGSTVPALRLLIQQSNCFVIVERGRAFNAMNSEREIMRSDEGRAGSNFGGGQMVAADFTMSPEVMMSDRGTSGGGAGVAGFGGTLGALSRLAGSFSTNEASTTLVMIDNRSGVQISASEGYAKNVDFAGTGALFNSGTAAAAGGYTRTPQGKLIMAAFVDSYNKMVASLQNYQAQDVKGGLGRGGLLGVQGGQTDASRALAPSTDKPAAATTSTKKSTTKRTAPRRTAATSSAKTTSATTTTATTTTATR